MFMSRLCTLHCLCVNGTERIQMTDCGMSLWMQSGCDETMICPFQILGAPLWHGVSNIGIPSTEVKLEYHFVLTQNNQFSTNHLNKKRKKIALELHQWVPQFFFSVSIIHSQSHALSCRKSRKWKKKICVAIADGVTEHLIESGHRGNMLISIFIGHVMTNKWLFVVLLRMDRDWSKPRVRSLSANLVVVMRSILS